MEKAALELGKDVKIYWGKIHVNPYNSFDNDSLIEIIKNLLKHNRPNSAVNCISLHYSKEKNYLMSY